MIMNRTKKVSSVEIINKTIKSVCQMHYMKKMRFVSVFGGIFSFIVFVAMQSTRSINAGHDGLIRRCRPFF